MLTKPPSSRDDQAVRSQGEIILGGFERVFDHRDSSSQAPWISLIVPVFNVEETVADCLISIRASASDTPIEIIVIDDGSTDDSQKVVRETLASGRWPPFVLIQQANQGLSASRNLGAQLARGKYLAFLDSDDLLEPESLSLLLHHAEETRADLVLARTTIFDGVTGTSFPFYHETLWRRLLGGVSHVVITHRKCHELLALEPNVNYRLILSDFYRAHQILFPVGLLFEDAPVHFKMLLCANRVVLLDIPYYLYRINRPGKITEEKSLRRFDVLEVVRQAWVLLDQEKVSSQEGAAALRVIFRLIWGCGTMTLPKAQAAFFGKAHRMVLDLVPWSWFSAYIWQNRTDLRHGVLGLIMREPTGFLLQWAFRLRRLISRVDS